MRSPLGILALLVLLLALTACGGEKNVSGIAAPAEPEPPVTGTVEAAPEPEFQMGEMSGGVYTNEFLGIGCSLDSNWTYLTDEEILELNASSAEQMTNEEIREMLETSENIYDMYAQADGGLVNIAVCVENLGVLNGITMDEAAYLEEVLPILEQSLAGIGLTDIAQEKFTETLAGQSHQAVKFSGMLNGDTPMYQEQVYLKKGSYMAAIILCSGIEDITPQLAAMFYALDN